MSAVQNRVFSLPEEHAAFIDAQVASGAFASASDVVREGLRALQEREEAVEHWLTVDVAAAYDAMAADPARGIPARAVFDEIRARHAKGKGDMRRRAASSSLPRRADRRQGGTAVAGCSHETVVGE